MTSSTRADQVLTLADAPDRKDRVRFCSRCGEEAAPRLFTSQPEAGRVCASCGLGLVLACAPAAQPAAGSPFLVVTDDLRISAVSEGAEPIFGTEDSLVGTLFLSLISSAIGDAELARRVEAAAKGSRQVVTLPVYAASKQARRGGALAARIASCGPPRGALILIDRVLSEAG